MHGEIKLTKVDPMLLNRLFTAFQKRPPKNLDWTETAVILFLCYFILLCLQAQENRKILTGVQTGRPQQLNQL